MFRALVVALLTSAALVVPAQAASPSAGTLQQIVALQLAGQKHHYRVEYKKKGTKQVHHKTYAHKKSAEKEAHKLRKHGYHVHVRKV